MTQAMPLWTMKGPEIGTMKWLGMASLVLLLSACLILIGCSFASVTAAIEADLPVVMQMITNISNVVAPGISPAIAAAGALALAALQIVCGTPAIGAAQCDPASIVGQYQATPTTTLLQKIDAALNAANTHITAMLALAKGLSGTVQAAITTAIGLALSTVVSLISLIPTVASAVAGKLKATGAVKATLATVPQPKNLKSAYNAAMAPQFPLAVIR